MPRVQSQTSRPRPAGGDAVISVDQIRAHALDLKRRRVRLIGHRAMLMRLLDEVDALTASLRQQRPKALLDADILYWASLAAREARKPSMPKIAVEVSAALPGALFELHKALARLDEVKG